MPSSSSSAGEGQASPQAGANVLITGGTFPQVHGDYHHNINPQSFHYTTVQHEIGLHTLNQAISHSAMHDSSERDPPPRCHPDTRKAIIKEIMQWIQDPAPSFDVFWLHGTAGVGKSAILQMIADLLRDMERHFGGAFFFGRGKAGRDKSDYLIPTIAYQLATLIPELRDPIDHAMRRDPALPKKNLDTQIRSLIVLPCQQAPPGSLSSHTPTVIIDGLDECSEHSKQVAILSAIARALNVSHVPLRFLIASRPEPHIAEFFQRTSCNHHGFFIPTDTDEVDEDMRKVFVDGFKDIRIRHAYIMSSLPQSWPGDEIVGYLVWKASGQFIYADTVLKFVGAESYSPTKQLKILLELPLTSGSSAFAPLDQLYLHILSSCPHQQTLKNILIVMSSSNTKTCAGAIEDLFGLEDGEVQLGLRGLHSVVQVVSRSVAEGVEEGLADLMVHFYPQDLYLSFYHASFLEFLQDQMRSKQFHVSRYDAWAEVASRASQLVLSTMDVQAWSKPVVTSEGREVEEPCTFTKSMRHDPRLVTWDFLSTGDFFHRPNPDLCPNLESGMCWHRSWTHRLQQSLASQTEREPSPHRFRALITIFLKFQTELGRFAVSSRSSSHYSSENNGDKEVMDSIVHISRTILNKWYSQVLTMHPLITERPLSMALLATSRCSIGEWSRVCRIDSGLVLKFLETHAYCTIASQDPWIRDNKTNYSFSIPVADFLKEEALPPNIQTTLRNQWSKLCCDSALSDSQACVQYGRGRWNRSKLVEPSSSSFFETPSVSDIKYTEQTQAYDSLQSLLSLLVDMDWSWSSLDDEPSRILLFPQNESLLVWRLLKWTHRQAESSKLSSISQQTADPILALMDKIFSGTFLLTQLWTENYTVQKLIGRDPPDPTYLFEHSQNLPLIYSSLCDFLSDEKRNRHAHEAIPAYHTRLLEYFLYTFILFIQDPQYRQDSGIVYREYERCFVFGGAQPLRVWGKIWPTIHWKEHFSHAVKSEKLENRLVAMHHICTVSTPCGVVPPSTWAEGVLEYLERMPDADPDGRLKSWCNELKDRPGNMQNTV